MSETLTLESQRAELSSANESQRKHSLSNRYEVNRLRTFTLWPDDWLDVNIMAMIGFWFTGISDIVQCHFCKVEISSWEKDDEPLSEHLRWSPNCPLLKRHYTDNVPIDTEKLDRLLPPVSFDVCERRGIDAACLCDTEPVDNYVHNEHPEYATMESRLESFCGWTHSMRQLAEAGFFYVGIKDWVKCFCCGGMLKGFKSTDDSWLAHALLMKDCRFLQLIKGEQFVSQAHSKNTDCAPAQSKLLNASASRVESESSDEHQSSAQLTCKICYENEPNIVFLPCGHVSCNSCAATLTKCPLCRSDLLDIKRIFL